MSPSASEALILGCGYVGTRLAHRLMAAGHPVLGVTSRIETATALSAASVSAIVGDLDRPDTLPELPTRDRDVHYLAPPPDHGDDDPRLGVFLERASRALPRRIVYVSTSGVYGDCQGAWVDETAPARPDTDRARRRYAAEQRLQAWSHATGVGVVILRVGGIYGPGRLPVERLRKGGFKVICPEEAPFSNRIHADDLAQALMLAAERGRPGEIYNAADGHPTSMTDYFYRVADHFGLPRPPCVPLAEAGQHLSSAMLSFIKESRRMRVEKIQSELGLRFLYPELALGLNKSS